ncbi:C40 family peptidase [Paenibacillus sp. Y412MC10]|uniref:C40 family peptidase n=1 Tax=Geobacillus sp. (strain Y412MC10) TaxID=481743 RepID=UPI0011A18141|nr:NlpC/P60 family protein [Paenibacillus sp. Y412MC10]
MNTRALISYAKRYVGIQYRYDNPPIRFDCSSFVRHVFAKQGIRLPRTVLNQATVGMETQTDSLRVADLLFFYVKDKHPTDDIPGHVGIYAGKRQMIHCIPTSNIFLTSIDKPHWRRTFLFARTIYDDS